MRLKSMIPLVVDFVAALPIYVYLWMYEHTQANYFLNWSLWIFN